MCFGSPNTPAKSTSLMRFAHSAPPISALPGHCVRHACAVRTLRTLFVRFWLLLASLHRRRQRLRRQQRCAGTDGQRTVATAYAAAAGCRRRRRPLHQTAIDQTAIGSIRIDCAVIDAVAVVVGVVIVVCVGRNNVVGTRRVVRTGRTTARVRQPSAVLLQSVLFRQQRRHSRRRLTDHRQAIAIAIVAVVPGCRRHPLHRRRRGHRIRRHVCAALAAAVHRLPLSRPPDAVLRSGAILRARLTQRLAQLVDQSLVEFVEAAL